MCKELKPVEGFHYPKSSRCRPCANRYRDVTRRRALAPVLAVVEARRASGCFSCGESDPVVLDFHHLRDKEIDIAQALASRVRPRPSVDAIIAELSKCVVLCANCHRRVTKGTLSLLIKPGDL